MGQRDERPKRKIRVFIASPSDLTSERVAFRNHVDLLNLGFGDGAGVEFVALGWEDTLASTGRRSQDVINAEIDSCDVFILAMHRRWGQEAPDSKFASYTEEEFHRALARWRQTRAPEVYVFFKFVDAASEADAGPQLKKVIVFRRELEKTRAVLYKWFGDEKEFEGVVDDHLRAYAKGQLPKVEMVEPTPLPLAAIERVEKAEAEMRRSAEAADAANRKADAEAKRAEAHEMRIAQRAAEASNNGRIEEARADFATLVSAPCSARVLALAFEFYLTAGDLAQAEAVADRLVITSQSESDEALVDALDRLGDIQQSRGDLHAAKRSFTRALEAAPDDEWRAKMWSSLGLIAHARGELDGAERLFRMSLEFNEKLGRLEGIANEYNNLGVIARTRGDLDEAERLHRKGLEIEEKLGRLGGVASAYNNLGLVAVERDDLDEGERLLRKSLELNKRLGRLKGVANQYGNLGVIARARGDLDEAERLLRKSLKIEEQLGRPEGRATDYGNLGQFAMERGDLDKAEGLLRKSLDISEKSGYLEQVAGAYCNLGIIAKERGKVREARELWTKTRDLYAKIGMPKLIKQLDEWLGGLPSDAHPSA